MFSEPRHRPDRLEIQARLLTIEELLVSGVSAPRVERELSKKFNLSRRQVRRYIAQVLANWQEDSREDVAIRREKLYRMAERLYGKAYAKESLTAANAALQTMARLGGAFAQGERDRSHLLEILGPPPTDDPMRALIYAQNVLVLTMKDIAEDPSIEPERRWKLLADLAAKVGMTHSRAVVQNQINTVKKRLGQSPSIERTDGVTPLVGVEKPKTARRTKQTSPKS